MACVLRRAEAQILREPEVFDPPGSRKGECPSLRIEEEIAAYLMGLAISPTAPSIGTVGSAVEVVPEPVWGQFSELEAGLQLRGSRGRFPASTKTR